MHKAYILIGLPGSGKSTLRNEMIAEGRANRYLNKDDIRESFPHASEREIHNHFISELEIIAIGGRDIHDKYLKPYFDIKWIVDDRKRVVDMWRGLGYTVFHCDEGDF